MPLKDDEEKFAYMPPLQGDEEEVKKKEKG